MLNCKKTTQGFTLIELLIVVSIIAILASVVFVALNPLQRFKDARDARRWSDVSELLNAIKLNQIDNGGTYISAITNAVAGTNYQIGSNGSGCDTGCSAVVTVGSCLDLPSIISSGHIGSIPKDPVAGTDAKTMYYLVKSATGVVSVGACNPEGTNAIVLTR